VSKPHSPEPKAQPTLVIDGSSGEGGGQVLRTSLALAILTGQPVRIEHIRAGRKRPGLHPQHLTGVRAAAAICDARLEGDELNSQTITFVPGGPARPSRYTFDVAEAARGGSAGSVGLVLQTVLLPLVFADGESHLTLRGGTHVPWAPPVSYLEHVFLPLMARMGLHAQIELDRWGFYPAGGGEIRVTIAGRKGPLHPLVMTERGALRKTWGLAVVVNLPAHIPQRMANRASNVLAEAGLRPQIEPRRLRGAGPGAGIFLFAEYAQATVGFTAYGRKGLPAEHVAEAACEELLAHHRSGAPVDPYLADQLVLPMALVEGESRASTSQVSQHLLTNVSIVQRFLNREVYVDGSLGEAGILVVKRRRA
jgi:RNA 3'-terminal phosphate cyclase (ATP)